MKRWHLFEFEDQEWFPANIRDYGTDFLQFVANKTDMYKTILPILRKGLVESGGNIFLDLASGGGGGWQKISENLEKEGVDFRVILSDYYPNIEAFKNMEALGNGRIEYVSELVSALDVPSHLQGFRTQFLSFHHFRPDDAQQILQNAVDHQVPIAIFEIQERTWKHLIQNLFSPISVLVTAPFIRPFKWGRLLFTYLIPIVPLFVLWDGVVSVLRTYSIEEMEAMTQQLKGGDRFVWEIGKTKNGPIWVLHLLGYPKHKITT